MNEFEFEKLIKEAMKDESSPSDILNAKLKQKIKKRYFIQKSFKGITTAVACIAVLVTGTLVLVNSNEGISNKLSDVPVAGNVAKVMTVNEFNKKDIVSQDNDISYTTENKTEDTEKNTPYNSKGTEETAQGNKTKTTTQKSNQVSQKKAEASIPKTESKEITDASNAVNQTMENDEYSLSVARSVDSHSEQQFDIWQGETQDEGVSTTEESAKVYEKLSDLYDEGYDYRKEISQKIKTQARERMALNPEIEYNIGDDFTITGNEEFYINNKNEIVIVFEEGVVAPKELGKVEFNIGITN